jgi:hypothetical protein
MRSRAADVIVHPRQSENPSNTRHVVVLFVIGMSASFDALPHPFIDLAMNSEVIRIRLSFPKVVACEGMKGLGAQSTCSHYDSRRYIIQSHANLGLSILYRRPWLREAIVGRRSAPAVRRRTPR